MFADELNQRPTWTLRTWHGLTRPIYDQGVNFMLHFHRLHISGVYMAVFSTPRSFRSAIKGLIPQEPAPLTNLFHDHDYFTVMPKSSLCKRWMRPNNEIVLGFVKCYYNSSSLAKICMIAKAHIGEVQYASRIPISEMIIGNDITQLTSSYCHIIARVWIERKLKK